MAIQKQRNGYQTSTASLMQLANGFILPEGKTTPNALFIGGIFDGKVDENEIRDFFARFGAVNEVKIITYRGGICKGYGFVYFDGDVDIKTIVAQQISFKGKKLKLGPAIMRERSLQREREREDMPSYLIGPPPWMGPSQCIYCTCCSSMGGGGVAQPSPLLNGGTPYIQPYSYPNLPGVMIPQMPISYSQAAYAYQYPSPQWNGEQRTRLVNQVHFPDVERVEWLNKPARFQNFVDPWNPDYADSAVVHRPLTSQASPGGAHVSHGDILTLMRNTLMRNTAF